jgi:flagellar basal body-associated protein FliL
MADPQEEAIQPEGTKGKRSIIRVLGVVLGIIMTFAIIGLLVFRLVVQPRLSEDPAQPKATVNLNTVSVPFDDAYVTVIMPSENMLASTLQYNVTFDCSNQETADLVNKYRPRIVAMLRKLHSYKTRAELDDPLVEESIRKQILQETNALLTEIVGGEDPEIRIVAVYHGKFYIQDA